MATRPGKCFAFKRLQVTAGHALVCCFMQSSTYTLHIALMLC